MEKKFIVPAVAFIAAILIWVLFFILYLSSNFAMERWMTVSLCALVGGLAVFSGAGCKKVGGPRAGSFVRSGMMLLFSGLSFWKVGTVQAGVLLLAAVVLCIIGLRTAK